MSSAASKVLVTGASGLIGTHVVQALIDAGYEPRVFSRHPMPRRYAAVEEVCGDVRDADALTAAMKGCDAAIHAAAVYSYSRAAAAEMAQTNIAGTRNALDAAARAGVERVVVTSSCATCGPVAGRPADERDGSPAWELAVPYKRTKLAAERIALERARSGQDVVIVNPTTTVGAEDRRPTPSGRMVRDVLGGRIRAYIAGGGLNVVSAVDVARGHVLALQRGASGERYLLGGENLSMRDVFAIVSSLGGVPAPRVPVPHPLALGVAAVADWVARRAGREPSLLVLDEVRLARLPMYFSSRKAQETLGYSHCSAEEALGRTVAWFSQRMPRRRPVSLALEYGHG